MEKIISLFQRNYDGDHLIRDEVVPGAEWVLNGEGVATRKYDGTCCKVEDGKLYKRYDTKEGKTPPNGFIPAQDPDPISGHWPGWIPVGEGPEDRWFREGWINLVAESGIPGHEIPIGSLDTTYELVGPKIQGNPEDYSDHYLVAHGKTILMDCPRTFEGIRDFLAPFDIEGIVWHHPDGRMVKIKKRDFGLKR